jgi:hypothetical protein
MPFESATDSRALTCGNVQWERIGPAAPALPHGLWTACGSARFFNGGRRTWPLIEKNKPADQASWASASPASAAPTPSSITLTQEFSVSAKNLYGVSVVMIRYRFVVQTGCRQGAPDQWIDRCSVVPGGLDIALGWTVGMTAGLQEPREYEDAGAAIAVLPVRIDLTIETKLKRHEASQMHLVTPAGIFSV